MALARAQNTKKKTFDIPFDNLKAVLQPMLELMALAQVAQFRNNAVPMVNILANRTAFRPFIYFRHEDVMIMTPKAVPFRRDANTINIQGLLLLFLVLRLHKTSSITFKMDIIKRRLEGGPT